MPLRNAACKGVRNNVAANIPFALAVHTFLARDVFCFVLVVSPLLLLGTPKGWLQTAARSEPCQSSWLSAVIFKMTMFWHREVSLYQSFAGTRLASAGSFSASCPWVFLGLAESARSCPGAPVQSRCPCGHTCARQLFSVLGYCISAGGSASAWLACFIALAGGMLSRGHFPFLPFYDSTLPRS